MKQGLKAIDFALFRLIPLVFLLFVLYADVRISFEAFNRIYNYSFCSFLESFSAILCFVILGFSSVLKSFKKTKKFSLYCRYGAGVMALIYIVNQAKDVLSWYDDMKNPVPTWYKGVIGK